MSDKKIANAMQEVINFLNPICKYRYPIKGFYRQKKEFGPPLMIFYYQDSGFRYLVNVEAIYALNLTTMTPMADSYIKEEIPDALKTLLKEAI